MSPDQELPAQARVSPAPMRANRAAQIHSVRKHEFAMLRELIHKGQGTSTGKVLAGLRGQTVRNKPATAETLDKINVIEEQLEMLWRTRATAAQASVLGSTPTASTSGGTQPLVSPKPLPAQKVPAQAQQARDKEALAENTLTGSPDLSIGPAISLPRAPKQEGKEITVTFDPLLLAAAQSFAHGEDDAAEHMLLQAIGKSQFPHPQTRYWALALLDIYRTHAEPSRFDWAVLEFVHWWYGKTPQWLLAPAKATRWVLRGRLQGPHAIDLPEVDASAELSDIVIDCTALLSIDAAASKALRHWLRRAHARQHVVQFEGVNLMVAASWEHIGFAQAAQWQLRPLP